LNALNLRDPNYAKMFHGAFLLAPAIDMHNVIGHYMTEEHVKTIEEKGILTWHPQPEKIPGAQWTFRKEFFSDGKNNQILGKDVEKIPVDIPY